VKRFPARLEDINAELFNILVLLLGILLVILGFFSSQINNKLEAVLLSIGTSMIASSVIVYLTSKYLIRQNNTKDIIEKWGLVAIYVTRSEMNISSNEKLRNMESELEIISFGMRALRDAQGDTILEKAKKGLKVKILTINPYSSYLVQREIDEKAVIGQLQKTVLDLEKWVGKLKECSPNSDRIKLKYYDALPLDLYFRVDDHIYIGPYLIGKTSQQTIAYEFKGNSLGFRYWKGYFDDLWENAEFAKDSYDEFANEKKTAD